MRRIATRCSNALREAPPAKPRFRETAGTHLRGAEDEAYGEFMRQTMAGMRASTGPGTRSADVAEAVWRAATDPSSPMKIPAGADAVQWARETS